MTDVLALHQVHSGIILKTGNPFFILLALIFGACRCIPLGRVRRHSAGLAAVSVPVLDAKALVDKVAAAA